MVRPVEHFRLSIAKAQQTQSSGGASISESEAREALYPALRAQDAFERTEVAKSVAELLGSGAKMGASTRKLLDAVAAGSTPPLSQVVACWKTFALAQAAATGATKVSQADLRDVVALIGASQDSQKNKTAALETARAVAVPEDWDAVLAEAQQPEQPEQPQEPTPNPRSVEAVKAFSEAIARLARNGANIDRPRALTALYLLAKGVDPADAGLVPEAIEKALAQASFSKTAAAELKQFAVGRTTKQVFDCWAAASAAGASSSASKVDETELREGLALVAMQDLSPADRKAAVERLRTGKLTATARALLEAELPDPAVVTPKAVARFFEVVALYRKPESEYQQNLNLPEAYSALHELLAPGVDPAQAAEAVRTVIAAGSLGSKAGPMLQAFAANPVVDGPRRFECWLAHASAAENQAGQGVTVAELEAGLRLLASPELAGAPGEKALATLRAAKLSTEARALLDQRFPTGPVTPDEPETPSDPIDPERAQATAAALDRFQALLARYRLPESEYQENLNLAEALSSLYLLAVDVEKLDKPAVTDAVRAVLASGKVGPKATEAFQAFADNPSVDAPKLFDFWLAHMTAAESDGGRTLSAAELGQGLTILALPAMTEASRTAALTRLGQSQLAPEARTLLDGYVASLGGTTPIVDAPTATGLDPVSVLARFRAQPANANLPERTVLELFYRHALTRHTGKTDQEIVDRLTTEPDISGSGSFTDEATTFRVIDAAIAARATYLADWMKRVPVNSMLTLSYRGEEVIGRGLLRGDSGLYEAKGARVVLQKLDETTYRIITAFPEK